MNPLAALLLIQASFAGPAMCGDWTTSIGDDWFTVEESIGCTSRASDWRQDGTWTVAEFTGCLRDFEVKMPDQTGRFRLVKTGDGPTEVEFSLFPEDGVLRATLCEAH